MSTQKDTNSIDDEVKNENGTEPSMTESAPQTEQAEEATETKDAAEFVAAPEPTPAAEAAGPDGPVDDRAYEQYRVIAQAVIESAENATRSAQAAADASRDMRETTTTVAELGKATFKRNQIILAAGAGVILISLTFFMIMGVRMISRINQLDAMVLAVGKRAVELNAGLESLNTLQSSLQDLAGKQADLKKSQALLETRIETSLKQTETIAQSLTQKVPQETAKQIAASSNSLLVQVQGLNSRVQAQATAVQGLGAEIKGLKTATANVDALKRDVNALITLQKERYLEALQKNNKDQQRERAVQYPRKDNTTDELMPRPQ